MQVLGIQLKRLVQNGMIKADGSSSKSLSISILVSRAWPMRFMLEMMMPSVQPEAVFQVRSSSLWPGMLVGRPGFRWWLIMSKIIPFSADNCN
jgi:hypothetical protein